MPTYSLEFTDDGGIAVNSLLQPQRTVVAADSPVNLSGADQIIFANPAAGNITINLPAAAGRVINGRSDSFVIVNIGASGTVTIDPNASETVNGAATLVLNKQYAGVVLRSNGSNWFAEAVGLNVPQAAIVALTDNTGLSGTHDDTLAATTVPAAITGGESPTEAEHNAVLTLLGVMVQNQSDVAQKVLEIRTALVSAGILTP